MACPDIDEVNVTTDPLTLGGLAQRVVCPTAGAVATFSGTTRDSFEGKQVLRLEVRACVLQSCMNAVMLTTPPSAMPASAV